MNLFLPIRRPGLLLGDFDFRLYAGATALALPALTVTDTSGLGDYSIAGLPDGQEFTLTANLAGTAIAENWGAVGSPGFIILPIRVHLATPVFDLSLELFRNGEPYTVAFTATEAGSPGDYAISGWPLLRQSAAWTLSWTYGSITGSIDWAEAAPIAATSSAADAKERAEARADLKADGRPVVYVFPPPPVDSITGEPPSSSPTTIQTWCIVQSAQRRIVSSAQAARGEASVSDASIEITLPAIDFATPPVAGGIFYLGPTGVKTFPVPGGPGVRALRMTTLYDAPADGVDEILYIAMASGDGPPRPS